MALSLLRVWQPQVTSWDSWHAPPDCLRQEVLHLRSNAARHEHPVLQPQLSPAPSEGRGPGLSLVRVQEPHGLLFPCLCHSKASPPSLHQPFPLRMTCRLWKENVGVRRPWRCLQCHPLGGRWGCVYRAGTGYAETPVYPGPWKDNDFSHVTSIRLLSHRTVYFAHLCIPSTWHCTDHIVGAQ